MKSLRPLVLLAAAAMLLPAQQLKFNLDYLAAKASDSVDLSLNGATLQFAARFLSSKDADESKVKRMIASLDGIYIRTFEFKEAGVWTPADLEGVRRQLRGAEWSRIVGVKSGQEGENAEIYVRTEDKKVNGVAILVAGPKELTIVNIVGPVDLDSLASLGGHLGIPKVEITKHK
jgi:hypothetical protein